MQHRVTIDHHIQRDILQRLAGGPLRFSVLKPDGLESNIFAYHLTALRNKKLVAKTGDSYHLAPAGLTYVDQLSLFRASIKKTRYKAGRTEPPALYTRLAPL